MVAVLWLELEGFEQLSVFSFPVRDIYQTPLNIQNYKWSYPVFILFTKHKFLVS